MLLGCHLTLWGGLGVGVTIQHYVQGLQSHLQKAWPTSSKKSMWLTHDLINFELTHVPTMIFFRLLVGEVLKNGMPDHIFLSSLHDSCTWYHGGGKRKLNKRQGFPYCKGFEKNGMSRQFFLSSFHDTCTVSLGKRKLNKRQGFTDWKGFENGVPDHIFLSSFHDTCTVSLGKKETKQEAGFYRL